MGEYVDIGVNQLPAGAYSILVSLVALCVFALLQTNAENDDDDSDSGGGGLMQPI